METGATGPMSDPVLTLDLLPEEILKQIFRWFTPKEISKGPVRVCRLFHKILQHGSFYRHLDFASINIPPIVASCFVQSHFEVRKDDESPAEEVPQKLEFDPFSPEIHCIAVGGNAFDLPPGKLFHEYSSKDLLPMLERAPAIQRLKFDDTQWLYDEALDEILTMKLRHLRQLELPSCVRVSDVGAGNIASQVGGTLTYLDVTNCELISDRGVNTLVQQCSKLTHLSLAHCGRLTNTSLRHLSWAWCTGLTDLNISGLDKVTDDGMAALCHYTRRDASPASRSPVKKALTLARFPGFEPDSDDSDDEEGESVGDEGSDDEDMSNLGCKRIKHLDMSECIKLTPQSLRAILGGCLANTIRSLNFGDCKELNDIDMRTTLESELVPQKPTAGLAISPAPANAAQHVRHRRQSPLMGNMSPGPPPPLPPKPARYQSPQKSRVADVKAEEAGVGSVQAPRTPPLEARKAAPQAGDADSVPGPDLDTGKGMARDATPPPSDTAPTATEPAALAASGTGDTETRPAVTMTWGEGLHESGEPSPWGGTIHRMFLPECTELGDLCLVQLAGLMPTTASEPGSGTPRSRSTSKRSRIRTSSHESTGSRASQNKSPFTGHRDGSPGSPASAGPARSPTPTPSINSLSTVPLTCEEALMEDIHTQGIFAALDRRVSVRGTMWGSLVELDLTGCAHVTDDGLVLALVPPALRIGYRKLKTLQQSLGLAATGAAPNVIPALHSPVKVANSGTGPRLALQSPVGRLWQARVRRDTATQAAPGTAASLAQMAQSKAQPDSTVSMDLFGSVVPPECASKYDRAHHFPLRKLLVGRTMISDAALLAILPLCPRLNTLAVQDCGDRVTDATMHALSMYNPELFALRAPHCPLISDEGVVALAQAAPLLSEMDVSYCTGVTIRGVEALVEHCPGLNVLCLKHCRDVDDQALLALGRLSNLEALDLTFCTRVSDRGVLNLICHVDTTCSTAIESSPVRESPLKVLDLSWCRISDATMRNIGVYCPDMDHLSVRCCVEVTCSGMDALVANLERVKRGDTILKKTPDIVAELTSMGIAVHPTLTPQKHQSDPEERILRRVPSQDDVDEDLPKPGDATPPEDTIITSASDPLLKWRRQQVPVFSKAKQGTDTSTDTDRTKDEGQEKEKEEDQDAADEEPQTFGKRSSAIRMSREKAIASAQAQQHLKEALENASAANAAATNGEGQVTQDKPPSASEGNKKKFKPRGQRGSNGLPRRESLNANVLPAVFYPNLSFRRRRAAKSLDLDTVSEKKLKPEIILPKLQFVDVRQCPKVEEDAIKAMKERHAALDIRTSHKMQ